MSDLRIKKKYQQNHMPNDNEILYLPVAVSTITSCILMYKSKLKWYFSFKLNKNVREKIKIFPPFICFIFIFLTDCLNFYLLFLFRPPDPIFEKKFP
jgi:hypothetical protein